MFNNQKTNAGLTWAAAAIALLSGLAAPAPVRAACPVDVPPPSCDNNGQFIGGRWDLSALTGSYATSGGEVFYPFLFDEALIDNYDTSGSLTVSMVGGPEENYLDVGCDGSVTGQFTQRFTGTIDKAEAISYFDPDFCIQTPQDMAWTIAVERTVSITGQVSGTGQLDLHLSVDTATLDFDGTLAASFDCVFISGSDSVQGFDITGDTESVRLAGAYDPVNATFSPTVSTTSGRPWIDDILHRVRLDQTHQFQDGTLVLNPSLDPAGAAQPDKQEYQTYLIQDAVTVTGSTQAEGESNAPEVTSLALDEPSQYLRDVAVTTRATATIDWRGKPPGTVEFTYGGTVETVPGADTVTWDFDAGEAGTTIQAVAIGGSARSQPFTINAPKVVVPGWAGTAADWSGNSGVSYQSTLDWPVAIETTRTLDTISLFSGLWGLSGGASSEFNARANSSGAPGAGDMSTQADFRFAGKSAEFMMEGPNQTTLACDELTTTGSATANLPGPTWQKTLSPASLVPGLQTAACALSSLLCGIVNSVGIKASAGVTLSGTGTYTGQGPEIRWDGGSLGGSITGTISAGASVPPPLSSVAGVEVYGGATGCIEFEVAPDIALSKLGGTLNAGASATFLGATRSAETQEPFGDACGAAAFIVQKGAATGWVPADGQLAMAATLDGAAVLGIAVWTEVPDGQLRPAGDIRYRFYRNGAWGAIGRLTDDVDSDVAPSVEFDAAGRALIVYQRSTAALPTDIAGLGAFADGYELHWALVDPASETALDAGQLTANLDHDFGPRLRADAAGGLHVFWQRAEGTEIAGTAVSPASIVVDSWDAMSGSWAGEILVATDLVATFGWSPAAYSADEMVIGLVLDTDANFATAGDRELFAITRSAGAWDAPRQLTTNASADDAALATFEGPGQPLLLWRRDAAVQQLGGDLLAAPAPAFTSPDPANDDGIAAGFAAGAAASGPAGGLVAWADGATVLLTRQDGGGAGWETPAPAFSTGESETLHFLRQLRGRPVIGYAVRAFLPGGTALSDTVEPRFGELPGDQVFFDGFE